MYDTKSLDANEFIDDAEVLASIEAAKDLVKDGAEIDRILAKARAYKGLTHREAAVLLEIDDDATLRRCTPSPGRSKNRSTASASSFSAYLSITVNNCKYCGYKCSNQIKRRRHPGGTTPGSPRLEAMYKRLLLEAGEDDENCLIEYIRLHSDHL